MPTNTDILAAYVTGEDHPPIPAEVFDVAKAVVLDGVAVIVAGTQEPTGLPQITTDYVRAQGGVAESSVVGTGIKLPMQSAAYANGTLGHALDYDNTWYPLNHPTSPTLPVLLAVAERDSTSPSRLLEALVLSYEVQSRIRVASRSMPMPPIFHNGTPGLMGAVAAAGRLLGLTAGQMRHAFGVAGSRAGSVSKNTGTMTKSSHSGHAARMGIECAVLAKMGWTANEDIFGEGRFLETFYLEAYAEPDLLVEGFGQPYRLHEPGIGFKLYPSNFFTHRVIDAALEIRAQLDDTDPATLEDVTIRFPDFPYVNRPTPRTGLDGKFSIQYCAAVALLDGDIRLQSFSNERLAAPDIQNLLPKIRLDVDEGIPTDFEKTYAIVEATDRATGRTLTGRCDQPRGMWGTSLAPELRHQKVHDCLSGSFLDGRGDDVIDLVEHLDEQPDVGGLMSLLRGG